ncbi:hypothetical protein F0562_030695 [Nyssa sinensis]|uniref:F-box associated beta-propeller type 3 domain-containing protein n=1 Tax=Nyssa sinensis TaxID=561372 RepID=A0A5J5B1D4_9ASTE|nr:hypothetical protein F0562_030695 [Nyssa sinensis]
MHGRYLSIMGSCNGFLCMASERSPNPAIICNPITREQICLPESVPDFPFFDHHIGLGYDLSTKKYKVVRMYMDNSEFNRFQIITLGESSWRQLDAPYRVLFWGIVGPIYCEGALYWIIDKVSHSVGNEYILVLDLSDEEFRTITIPSNIRMPRLMHVWRVISNRGRNCMVHHYTCDMYVHWNVFSRPVLVSMLGEDSFLLEVSKFGLHWERDLVQYFPQMRQYYNLKIDRLPTWFRSICFSPNLISPHSVLFHVV